MAKAKSNSIITTRIIDENVLEWTVLGAGTFTLDKRKVHQDNRDHAEDHGWIQRLSDGAALSRDTATGASASPQEKFEAMVAIRDHYESGSAGWRLGGRATSKARAPKVDFATIREAVTRVTRKSAVDLTDDRLMLLGSADKIQAMVSQILAERQGPEAKAAADAALEELMNQGDTVVDAAATLGGLVEAPDGAALLDGLLGA